MIGADISSHQEGLKIAELKAKGMQFVIVKATQGTHYINPYGAEWYMDARAQNLPAGVYCYSEALTPQQAELEAYYLLDKIQGWPMPCGVWLDVEKPAQLRMPPADLQATVGAWCNVIRAAGYIPGVYSSEHSAWAKLDPYALGEDVLVWVAHYGKAPDMPCDLWQYTDREPVDGHKFTLDVDVTRSKRFEAMVKQDFGSTAEEPSYSYPIDEPCESPLDIVAAFLRTDACRELFKAYIAE